MPTLARTSIDTIAVKVAWSRRYHWAADGEPSGIGLAKLISGTVRFGPVEPFFPAYPLSIEAMSSRGEARPSGRVEKKTI
jgi:hypothetical protein